MTGTKKNLARSCRTDGSDDKKQRLQPQEELPPTLQKQQEAERQPSQHPPVFHVWPAVLALLTASGQERQVVARVTASDHESDLGERVTASGHPDLPGRQGTRTLNDVTGSSQTTATRHTESGHGKTDIDPRIDTGLPAIESAHVESGSGPKTAPTREALSYPHEHHDPKIGSHERIKRGSEPPKAPTIPHIVERAARNGESQPRSVAGIKKDRCDRATYSSPAPEGASEARACSRATDNSPEALPPLSLDLNPAGGEEAPGTKNRVHTEPPTSTPDHLKGGKEKRKKAQLRNPRRSFRAGRSQRRRWNLA